MQWSYQIGRLAGIPIRVHATFLLLLAFAAIAEGGLAGVLFTLVVFGAVVFHELGHALAARGFGIRTRDITLLPVGGVARLERMPEEPFQELVVALAGPAVNGGLALLSLGALALATVAPGLAPIAPFLLRFLFINVGLGLFNLLPAFPMDGGRALRALLATRMTFERATRIAARTGRWIAGGLALAGIFFSPTLVFVAAFVWFAGAAEERVALGQSRTVYVRDDDLPLGAMPYEARPAPPRVVHYRVYDSYGRPVIVSVREPS